MTQNEMQSQWYSILPQRGLITISGADAQEFLQGLITNDVYKLKDQPCVYGCLLTPQGKFLYDFFMTSDGNKIFLDCEGGSRARELEKRLGMYRLRKDITIACEESMSIYAVFGSNQYGTPDPRHPDMGYRSFEKPEGMAEKPFVEWDKLRISLTIPDGSRDLIVDKSTMDEARMDTFNAIDYKKGCYVGQELTARMHYRGLGKKHLETVLLKPSLRANEDAQSNPENWIAASASQPPRNDESGKVIELRSHCEDIGIALIRSET